SPDFDLVIGNPPWVSRKPAPEAETWLTTRGDRFDLDSQTRRRAALLKQTLFPEREVACAFMWKADQHLAENGRVCQVLPSRVFLSNNKDRFQAAWLRQHQLESVWLLADYSFILFSTADCPCVIARYRSKGASALPDDFEFVTPKVESLDPRQ